MEKLFRTYPIDPDEVVLIISALEDPTAQQSQTRTMARKYSEYLDKLLSTQTPRIIADRHLELTNSIGSIVGALENLSQDEADVVTTAATLVQINPIVTQAVTSIVYINSYFEIIQGENMFDEENISEAI